jgi:hypothetical protein
MASRANQPSVSEQSGGRQTLKLKQRALHEARKFFWIFVYLWVLFGLFALHESIILARHDIEYLPFGFAALNALVLGKVILIGEDLHFARGLEDRPLIYAILYKSAAFAVMLICFRIVEKLLHGVLTGHSVAESLPAVGGSSVAGILAVGLIVFVALIPFFAFSEIGRVMGEDKLRSLLLKERRTA